jgi:engulfment and cell motility protein 3
MLDHLWKKNLRQFIYKVGWTRPRRPSPQSSFPWESHPSLVVFQNIIHSATPMGDEMAHHLYVLQALTLGLLEPRMRTPLDPYSQVRGDKGCRAT